MNVRHFRDHVLPEQLPGELTGGATFSLINSLGSLQVEPPPPWSTPWRAYRWSHLLPDQLPGELTGGATSSLINSLESLQVEPPPPWSTPWRAYRWSHLLPDQLPGELTGGATSSLINWESLQARNTFCAVYLVIIAFSAATQTHTHSWLVGVRWLVE